MISELSRRLTGQYIQSNTTVLCDSTSYLNPGDELVLHFNSTDSYHSTNVVSATGNVVVVDFNNPQYAGERVDVKTTCFGGGLTGVLPPFSLNTSTTPNSLVQAISNGGTSIINLEVSTDFNRGWVTFGQMVPTLANSNSAILNVTTPWPYGRLNVLSIGAGVTIRVNKAS